MRGAKQKTSATLASDVGGGPALFAKGMVCLEGLTFSDGTIECDMLGKSAPRQSNFLGIAFRGAGEDADDCVDFRPFNFRPLEPENAEHAVQYFSHPEWPFNRLRAERPGQYEKGINPPPDGDAWLHARIVIRGRKVSVYVNDSDKPALEVEALSDRPGGRIDPWARDGQGRHFSNLRITPAD